MFVNSEESFVSSIFCLVSLDCPFTWPRIIDVATILVDKGLVAPFEAGHKEKNDNKIDFKTNVDILLL